MERFIVAVVKSFCICSKLFKIQYGEIYSWKWLKMKLFDSNLKSSMERFIASCCVKTKLL